MSSTSLKVKVESRGFISEDNIDRLVFGDLPCQMGEVLGLVFSTERLAFTVLLCALPCLH